LSRSTHPAYQSSLSHFEEPVGHRRVDARACGAELVTTVALEHLHQLVLKAPGSVG
jgi:hypothetical protein